MHDGPGNGSIKEALELAAEAKEDSRSLRQLVFDEFRHMRQELKDIKTCLDLLLAMAAADEKKHEAENG